MSAPAGRTTRSRYSSPYTTAPKDSPKETAETSNSETKAKRGPLDGWLEPPIPQPKPSFAEAGMERHGVVLNMAPLGTLPTSKIIKGASLKASSLDGASRRSRRETSVASTPAESLANPTPEPTQTPELVQTPEMSAQGDLEPIVEDAMEVDGGVSLSEEHVSVAREEEQYTSPGTPQQMPYNNFDSSMSQSPRFGQGVNGEFASRPVSEPYMGNPAFPIAKFGPPGFSIASGPLPFFGNNLMQPGSIILPLPNVGPDNEFVTNLDRTDSVIEHAVQAALDDGKWPTAYALRTLYDDQRDHPPSVRVIEAVYGGFANPEQRQQFLAQVTQRKKLGKKDRMAEYYFNGDGSDFVVRPRRSSLFSLGGMPQWNPSVFSTPPFHQPQKYQTPYSPLPLSGPPSASLVPGEAAEKSSPQPLTKADSPPRSDGDDIDGEPPTKKMRISESDVVPPEMESANMEDEATPSQPNETNKSKSPEPHASRSGSVSSTSSLSSINEDVLLSTSTFNSPEKQQRHASPPVNNNSSDAASGDGNTTFSMQKNPAFASMFFNSGKFISPYASKENFEKVAETVSSPASTTGGAPVVQPPAPPTKAAPKPGPKTFLFSIHKPTSTSTPGAPASSSATKTPPNSSETLTTSSKTHTRAKSSMAPTTLANSSSSISTTTTTTPSGNPPTKAVFRTKGQGKGKEQTPPIPYDANDATSRLKRKARDRTNRSNTEAVESFIRAPLKASQDIEIDSDVESSTVRPAKKPTKIRLNTRTRNNNYDSEENSSPTLLSFQPDLAPGSLPTSRAGTPNNLGRSSRKGKTGTGLRVKTSPMKKKGGILAGLSRPSGERNSPTTGLNGAQEDNDDYCSSCGGNGGLVCCDGCTRSFHYQCVDPPMIEDALPDDPWFCNVCQSSRQPPPPDSERRGAFGDLLVRINERNPSAFQLPQDIRDYFEGVKTGAEGEYEDIVPPKTRANRPGWEEQPDYFRTRDAKGALILCYLCKSTASAPSRKIIPCTYCTNYWHLDCVPNPMAKEPGAGRQWRCPLHVDDLLSTLPAILAPAHKFRKIKGTNPVHPTIPRGNRNNGHIEIENELSDDESNFYELREWGKVYKVSDKTIKLDFLSKAKENGRNLSSFLSRKTAPTITQKMSQHSIEEQQAALNLASLASQTSSLGDHTTDLIHALLDGALPTAISLIAQGNGVTSGVPYERDRQSLLMIRELINSKLGMMADAVPGSEKPLSPYNGDDIPNVNTPPSSVVLKAEGSTSVLDESSRPSDGGEDEDMLL